MRRPDPSTSSLSEWAALFVVAVAAFVVVVVVAAAAVSYTHLTLPTIYSV